MGPETGKEESTRTLLMDERKQMIRFLSWVFDINTLICQTHKKMFNNNVRRLLVPSIRKFSLAHPKSTDFCIWSVQDKTEVKDVVPEARGQYENWQQGHLDKQHIINVGVDTILSLEITPIFKRLFLCIQMDYHTF